MAFIKGHEKREIMYADGKQIEINCAPDTDALFVISCKTAGICYAELGGNFKKAFMMKNGGQYLVQTGVFEVEANARRMANGIFSSFSNISIVLPGITASLIVQFLNTEQVSILRFLL